MVSLGMDLAILCYVEMKIAPTAEQMPFGCFHFTQRINCGYPPPSTLHPYRSVCGTGVANKKLSRMAGYSASYLFNFAVCSLIYSACLFFSNLSHALLDFSETCVILYLMYTLAIFRLILLLDITPEHTYFMQQSKRFHSS